MKENPKPRLLIIDDEANMRHMLYSMLKNEYDMELAESGSSGSIRFAGSQVQMMDHALILYSAT